MKHFYTTIPGWFDYEKLYTRMVNEHDSGAHFVEIGAAYGKSTSYMAVEIANSGKVIEFDVVDTWRGSPEHQENGWDRQPSMIDDTAFGKFRNNLKKVKRFYNPIRLLSVEAAANFEDESLDFVFIDAAHEYKSIKADIEAWLPKIKYEGYIGGHAYVYNQSGVVKAVNEKFGDDKEIIDSCCRISC